MSRLLGLLVLCVVAGFARPARAERPQLIIDRTGPVDMVELPPNALLPYSTIYLNRCAGSGCLIKVGEPSSITNSWYLNSQRTLTPFPYSDDVWAKVVTCVKDIFEPFNVNITEVDPGNANHFEVMIAGGPGDLGMAANIGGIAPGSSCTGYVNNALVFDFPKTWGTASSCDAACIENICATAGQELGHAWRGLDHVIDNRDPMTYFSFSGRKYFQNSASVCGSDCVGGTYKRGGQTITCTGSNMQQRPCNCGGMQNAYTTLRDLFGAGPGSPPTVKILSPKLGASVEPGFPISVEPMDNSGIITKVEVKVDGVIVGELTKGPWVFNAPATLANGTHKVEAIAYDPHQTQGVAMVNVNIGPPCGKPSDCPNDTDTCVGGRCVPGAGVQGGLGTTCAANTECASGLCADDGSNQYCVEGCLVGDCPDDFGCLETENPAEGTTGVCWPGYDDGSGGCGCQSSRGGPLSILMLFGWVVLTCRRRRRS